MAGKRTFDLAIGIPLAIAAAPVIAIVAVSILLTSGPPAFLVQERVGAWERPIRVVKFRTMRRGTPTVAKSLLEPSPGLYTPLGPFLRRWSLDEMPQILNLLRGDMSLVGPRPALPSQHDLLALRRRHGITEQRPGLTGLAQALGRESLTLSTKVRCEALYRRRESRRLDLAILCRTARVLLSGRGAY
ncbi:MAG: sugar transferase [Candidatus Limnocylindria bacterium]